MRQLTALLCLFGLFQSLGAQDAANFWSPMAANDTSLPETAPEALHPRTFQAYTLQYDAFCQVLARAPMEFSDAAGITVELPRADGSFQTFEVYESPIMAPELYAKYPAIRNYAGMATDGSGMSVRLGVGYQGFHAFLIGRNGSVQSIRPYTPGQQDIYMAYRLTDLPREAALLDGVRCGVEEHDDISDSFAALLENGGVADRGSALVNLKKFRVAIAAKGEYSVFHGGTKPLVLAAINTALDFIVAIKERDFAVRFELIPENDQIIFLDPNTDPYDGTLVSLWMNQNPAAIDSIIPNSSYDIGHVFCRFVTGNQVGIVSGRACDDATKARGASSAQMPNAEYFFLVAAHEFCHQLSGSHTWSNCPGNETQIAEDFAFEPGSGSTIMSYAGSCSGGNNVQTDNDAYFHLANIIQVQNFVATGGGSTCGSTVTTTNNAPEVTIVSPKNVAIPISTPFRLTASGSDIDGDNLTYCWEQYDKDPGVYTLGSPQNNAPAFRSYDPTTAPTRYFPNLADLSANISTPVEVLPTYNRTLTFRVTVRDNHTGGGGQAWEEIKISPRVSAGPFRVTYPNAAGIAWAPGSYQVITWDVANTDNSIVNCKKVNIRMSTDGGQTFPTLLAANVPNRGRYCVQVPNVTTGAARIMVEAADNVFFDISNNNVAILAATVPGYSFCAGATYDTLCLPQQYSTVISTYAALGFSDPITLTAEGLPMGVTATFTPNPVTPGNDAVLTLDFPAGQPEQVLEYDVKGDANGMQVTTTNTLWVAQGDYSALALVAPADGAGGESRSPVLRWTGISGTATYDVEVATNPSFAAGTIVTSKAAIAADSFVVPVQLEEGAVYYWRFRVTNICGTSDWAGPFAFGTLVDVCASFAATDVPLNITSSAAVTVESKITIPSSGLVSDVNITKIQGSHAFFKDLEMSLVSPAGTEVLLFKDKCGAFNGSFNFGFDDTGVTPFACPPANNGTRFVPENLLNVLNGQDISGDWILRVRDNVVSSGGNIQAFELELCSSTALNPPVLINNNPLQVAPGNNAVITTDLLKTEDPNNSDAELVYTLMTVPQHGHLEVNWTGVLLPGAQFTQADLNSGSLRYFDYGGINGTDSFCFTVTDGEGGLVKDCFTIQQFPVSAGEVSQALEFQLAPNPATETVRLLFGEPLRSDTRVRVFDTAGRLVQHRVLGGGQTVLLLQVAELPEGLYIIAVDNAEGSGVRRLMVR